MSDNVPYFHDFPYFDALEYVMSFGEDRPNRTGTDARSVFGLKMNWDVGCAFPLITSKRVHWRSIINELIWFVNGGTNTKWLREHGVTIWDEWADENGDLGPVYGKQWRKWWCPSHVEELEHGCRVIGKGVDQLQECVDSLIFDPYNRRMIVSAWNVCDLPRMALAPCHMMYQFYVREDEYLDLQVYQRSCDMFLGVPFNIASYAALIYMIGHITGLKAGELHWVGGDCHIYENHFDQVKLQLSRTPPASPTMSISHYAPTTLKGWESGNFRLRGYEPMDAIRGEVAV